MSTIDPKPENKNKVKPTIAIQFGAFTDLLQMADRFLAETPMFYDRNKMWWLYDFEQFKYVKTDEVDIFNALDRQLYSGTQSIKYKNEIIEALRRRARLKTPKTLTGPYVQFGDTIVNVKNRSQFKASPSFFCTSPIPHKIGKSTETPLIDKLFRDWVVGCGQDESWIQTLYEMFAYTMLNEQFMQRLFACTGYGSNGKGTMAKLLMRFIGIENVCTTELTQLSKGNFETSALYKKQLAIMGEVDSNDLKNTNLLKKLSGEDLIRYEFKGHTPFSEASPTTCLILTNALPLTPDHSDGFYRRWLIIDFPHQFPVAKDPVEDLPEEEYENLAAKCIEIAAQLYKTHKFTNEGTIDDRKNKYATKSNPLLKFIEKYCTEEVDNWSPFSLFYNKYLLYLTSQRLRKQAKNYVSKQLKEEGYNVAKVNYEITGSGGKAKWTSSIAVHSLVLLDKDIEKEEAKSNTVVTTSNHSNHVSSDSIRKEAVASMATMATYGYYKGPKPPQSGIPEAEEEDLRDLKLKEAELSNSKLKEAKYKNPDLAENDLQDPEPIFNEMHRCSFCSQTSELVGSFEGQKVCPSCYKNLKEGTL